MWWERPVRESAIPFPLRLSDTRPISAEPNTMNRLIGAARVFGRHKTGDPIHPDCLKQAPLRHPPDNWPEPACLSHYSPLISLFSDMIDVLKCSKPYQAPARDPAHSNLQSEWPQCPSCRAHGRLWRCPLPTLLRRRDSLRTARERKRPEPVRNGNPVRELRKPLSRFMKFLEKPSATSPMTRWGCDLS